MEGASYLLDQNKPEYKPAPATLPYPTHLQQTGYIPPPQPNYSQDPAVAAYPEYRSNVPPPYSGQVQPIQQQSNTVTVVQQPTPVYTQQRTLYTAGDNFLTLSITLTMICITFGTWCSLLCTIPAIIFAIAAKDAERRGDFAGAKKKKNAALSCNLLACVWWVIALILIIVISIAVVVNSDSSDDYYYA